MKKPPRGKIGRLPQAVQDQINRRLQQGERARTLVAWLNSLPEVPAVLAAEFAGQPVNEKNPSKLAQARLQTVVVAPAGLGDDPRLSGVWASPS